MYVMANEELSKAEIREIFGICRKSKKLKLYEERLLIENKDLLNTQEENILHNYIKCNGYRVDLIERMVDAGHDMNNKNKLGNTIFESLMNCSKTSADIKAKILAIIFKNCDNVGNKSKISLSIFKSLIVASRNWYSRNMINYTKINNDYFTIIKKLLADNKLDTDISKICPEFNIGNHVSSIGQLKWFDKNFTFNWDIDMIKNQELNKECYNDMINLNNRYCYKVTNNPLINCVPNIEIYEFLLQKNPAYIYKPQHAVFLLKIISRKDLKLIKFFYENKIDTDDHYDNPKKINGYIGGDDVSDDELQKKYDDDMKKIFDNYMKHYETNCYISTGEKQIYMWLILNKKMKLTLGSIRRLNISFSDFQNIDNINSIKHVLQCAGYNYNGNNNLSIFPSDDDVAFKTNEKIQNNIVPLTKNQCRIQLNLINEFYKL